MRARSIVLFAAAAVAFGTIAAHEALGGNHVHANQQFYAVKLTLGQYFYSGAGRRMVVDDVTYSVQYAPCGADDACDFFSESDIPDQFVSGQTTLPQTPPTTNQFGFGGSIWMSTSQYMESVSSKHQWTEVGLCNGSSEGIGGAIDAFSIATYGQLGLRSWRASEGFNWIAFSQQPGSDGGAGAGGDGLAIPHAMAMTLASVGTRGSRHFQSPPQSGDRVYFVVTGGTPMGAIAATAFVRGRTFAHSTQPPEFPVPDNTITIGGP
jgi:hypothetical protein